jgi:hypothetical protein
MALPDFNSVGDLPPGIHVASIADVLERFGEASPQREKVFKRLSLILQLAKATSHLERFIIFGSFVSDDPHPNDVDVILVMNDDFRLESCPSESLVLYNHMMSTEKIGASVFWVRPSMLLGEPVDAFVGHWQVKRGGERRGIVEVEL